MGRGKTSPPLHDCTAGVRTVKHSCDERDTVRTLHRSFEWTTTLKSIDNTSLQLRTRVGGWRDVRCMVSEHASLLRIIMVELGVTRLLMSFDL